MKHGGSVTAEADAEAEAIGSAIANAYVEAVGYVDVEGEKLIEVA